MARMVRATHEEQSLLKEYYDGALKAFIPDEELRTAFAERAAFDFVDDETVAFTDAAGATMIAYSWLLEPQSPESQKVRELLPQDLVQYGISRDFFGYIEQAKRLLELHAKKRASSQE